MEPGFTYTVDNEKFLSLLREEFYNNSELIKQNGAKTLYDRPIGAFECRWNTFWKDNIDLYNYIESVTYPRDPNYRIDNTWMRYYIKDSFSALHIDVKNDSHIGEDQITNVILLDQSEDIDGGLIVIAGESYNIDLDVPVRAGNIKKRLLTRFLKNPGDAIMWDEKTIHGVSKIEKGFRLVFVCTKIPK
jgi:hypothetical protein